MAPASLPSLRILSPPLLLLLGSSLHVDGGAFVTKRGVVSGCRSSQGSGIVAATVTTSNAIRCSSSLFRLPWKSSSSHSTVASAVVASAETFASRSSSRPPFAKFRNSGGGGCGGFTGRGGGQSSRSSSSIILHSTEVDNDIASTTTETTTAATTDDGTTNGDAQSSQQETSSTKGKTKTKILYEDNQFLKPQPDRRSYRSITLSNGLIVLLASDPKTDVESGAVHVKAGHFNDPPNRAGLAHFHEHMLFLGTQKYPEENEYEGFLSRNGGGSNAYTDMEDTNYYFSVAALGNDDETQPVDSDTTNVNGNNGGTTSPALAGALDRFAQFFIAPTFRTDMVEREMRAINSEYLNGITSDAWRNYQLLKDGCNVDHPFHKFGCGNYQTLTNGGTIINSTLTAEQTGGSSPRNELLQFWKDNYHPSNMRLCVVGRASLDELQKTVEETFGYVDPESFTPLKTKEDDCPDDNINGNQPTKMFPTEHSTHNIAAFTPKQLGLIREVIPLMESRIIKVHFAGPPMSDPTMKESRAYRVLSHLLGHESIGSLHSVLNDLGYISGLSSGVGIDVSDFSLLSMTITLTPHGYQNRDHVLSLLFQYISLLKSLVTNNTNNEQHNGLMEQYHNELKQMSNVNFQFRENGDPTDFCSSAASLLFDYESNLILGGSTLTGDYNGTVAKALLDRMVPENSLIVISSPDLDKEGEEGKECCRTSAAEGGEWMEEKWYRAKYRQIPISTELIEEWSNPETVDSRLKLPKLNEFIPRDFSLRCDDNEDDDDNIASDTTDPSSADTLTDDSVQPPNLLLSTPKLRLWHKMDTKWRVPKTSLRLHITSPNVYFSPRSMTLNRIYQRVLNDDLNEFVYDASVAGCNYRVSCVPTGLRISVSGYSEKLPSLLDTVTTRMLTLLHDLKEGPTAHPTLSQRFQKAKHNLLRETKNYKLDSPYEIASYNSRLLMEEKVWHLDSYVDEMEEDEEGREEEDGEGLSMEECGRVVEECLTGRVKAEALCIGNINESEAQKVADVIDRHFLQPSRPLSEDETPTFRSMKLPTKAEAIELFGPDIATKSIPVVLEDVAYSTSEENSAVEVILQAGCEHDLGYEGVALLELIGNMAYSSAFNQLRTKEQLGYLVSAFTRKTAGGAISLAVIVQSSAVPLPSKLEERIEAWLQHTFRSELENMSEERIVMEAEALVAQFLERDVRLSEEIGRVWGEILATETLCERLKEPVFDRHERLADAITVISPSSSESDDVVVDDDDNVEKEKEVNSSLKKKKKGKTAAELKRQIIHFFDEHFASDAPKRRAMVARVYSSKVKDVYEGNKGQPGILSSYDDVRNLKQYLSSWPLVPYWKKKEF